VIASRPLRYWLGGTLVAALLVYLLRGALLPFVAGMAVAYFLDPVVDRFEAWKLSRTWATTVVTVLFFALLLVVVVLLAPVVQGQIVGFADHLPGYLEKARELLLPLLDDGLKALDLDGSEGVPGTVAGVALEAADIVTAVLAKLWSGGLAVINILSLVFITPVVAFYLLRDWDHIVARVDSWLPRPQAQVIRELVTEVDGVLAGFVRGTGTVCLILGVFYALALTLVGLDFGLILGLGAGLISFVPFVGALAGLLIAGGLALVQFWGDYLHIVLVIGVFAVGQVVEGNLLTPRLVGSRIGLHPVWVIFALLAGATVFGFLGVLLAVPLAAAVGVLVRFGVARYLVSGIYLGPGGGDPGAKR
jgi:predicted PurR-regulated permease PerM